MIQTKLEIEKKNPIVGEGELNSTPTIEISHGNVRDVETLKKSEKDNLKSSTNGIGEKKKSQENQEEKIVTNSKQKQDTIEGSSGNPDQSAKMSSKEILSQKSGVFALKDMQGIPSKPKSTKNSI